MNDYQFSNIVVFKIRGDQLLADPAISSNSSNDTATIGGGSILYPMDWTIEITAKGAINNDTELNGASGVLKIRIFDENGQLVDTFNPMNSGQYASIQNGIAGVGDGYLRFNSNVLINEDGQSFAGSAVITNCNNSFYNLPITFENGNMAYDIMPHCSIVPCFVSGGFNRIKTEIGDEFVEDLKIGDKIYCVDSGEFKPIIYISKRIITGPIGLKDLPYQYGSVLLSRQHRILTNDDKLVRACNAVVEDICDRYDSWPGSIEYINIFLEQHEIILVNGKKVESGWLGGKMSAEIIGSENWQTVLPYLDGHKNPVREIY